MTHKMRLYAEFFEKVVAGTKDVEIRLYDEKRKAVNPGDEIEFTNTETGETVSVVVKGLIRLLDKLIVVDLSHNAGFLSTPDMLVCLKKIYGRDCLIKDLLFIGFELKKGYVR